MFVFAVWQVKDSFIELNAFEHFRISSEISDPREHLNFAVSQGEICFNLSDEN